jgi:hypothetical protein
MTLSSQSNQQPLDIIHIEDLDVVYLTYDEPQREEFWLKIKNMVPWATRVDGVKGSDAAHKAAAAASTTERFILIDGDNMLDEEFLDQSLTITHENQNVQFRWRSYNYINGLYYGNGGVSSWTKTFVNAMRTHEAADPADPLTNIEFCYHPQYWPMHNCYSTTYPNYSAKQAWRAGFREGVKLCGRSGEMPQTRQTFKQWVWPTCMRNLWHWWSLGRDVENGWWAMYGARLGTHYLMMRDWDHREVQDFSALDVLWELHKTDTDQDSRKIAQELNGELGLNIVEIEAQQSQVFKEYIVTGWRNTNIMDRETY